MVVRRNLKGRLELTWMGKDQALIPTTESTYDYTWVDPSDPRACQTHYLIHDEHVGDQLDGGNHDNLLVVGESGDVLEALTRVAELADKYVGRVKLVYIDPPFNTEKTFSHYEDNLEHSVWLTMMRDRLMLIKRLLSDDGSIWVHLDDSENHRMRVLMDEAFGAENFVSEVVWQKAVTPRNNVRGRFSSSHDTLLVYRKSDRWLPNRLDESSVSDVRYRSPDGDPVPWRDNPIDSPGSATHQGMVYAIQHPITGKLMYTAPGRSWGREQSWLLKEMSEYAPYELRDIHDEERRAAICGIPASEVRQGVQAIMLAVPLEEAAASAQERYDAGNWPAIYLTKRGKGGIQAKAHIHDQKRAPDTMWLAREVGANITGKSEIQSLFPEVNPFATPKPEALLQRVIHISSSPGDVVLDCFAGSGTTAAVAHKMGRRWVTCELLPDTVKEFTRPRLEMVIAGTDQGGISSSTERVADDGVTLPDGVGPLDAQRFTTLLGKFADEVEVPAELPTLLAAAVRGGARTEDGNGLDSDEQRELLRLLRKVMVPPVDLAPSAVKGLRQAARTRDVVTAAWHGGGGFDVARLSPVWVGVDVNPATGETVTYTTPEATGEVLQRSVAAHLGFYFTPGDSRFCGVKGRQRLALIEGVLTEDKVEELAGALRREEAVTIVCDGAPVGVAELLGKRAKGSRLLIMPDGLFTGMIGTGE